MVIGLLLENTFCQVLTIQLRYEGSRKDNFDFPRKVRYLSIYYLRGSETN